MGKITTQEESIIQHFSHQHPLQLFNYQNPNPSLSCSCCKQKASGVIYSCTYCNYFLHISCSKLPQQITHPFDQQNHVLSLLPRPIYPEGLFKCDACSHQGNGFCYHCGTCSIDLHTSCATKPMVVTSQYHPHPLNLTFSAPYHNKGFSCDICRKLGGVEWLYRCTMCEFDAHLVCATKPHVQTPAPANHNVVYQVQQAPPVLQTYYRPNQINVATGVGRVRPQPQQQQQQNVTNQFMMGVYQGLGQAAVDAIVTSDSGPSSGTDTSGEDMGGSQFEESEAC